MSIEIKYVCPSCGGTEFSHEDNATGNYEVVCSGCGFLTDINEVKQANTEKARDISNKLTDALKKQLKR